MDRDLGLDGDERNGKEVRGHLPGIDRDAYKTIWERLGSVIAARWFGLTRIDVAGRKVYAPGFICGYIRDKHWSDIRAALGLGDDDLDGFDVIPDERLANEKYRIGASDIF